MAYAVFKDHEKLSRTFAAKEQALKKANEAGLVENIVGKPVLKADPTIKPCERKSDEDFDWVPTKR
jgi:hypothetical protein